LSTPAIAGDEAVLITPGKVLVQKQSHPTCIEISGDSTRLIIGDTKGNVIVWDYESDAKLFSEELIHGAVTAVAISDDGVYGLAGGFGGQLVHITIGSKPKADKLPSYSGAVTGIAFSPKQSKKVLISTGGDEGVLYDVDLGTGRRVASFGVAKSGWAKVTKEPRIVAMDGQSSSRRIAISIGPAVGVLDAKTKQELGFINIGKSEIERVHLFQDDSALALVHHGEIHLYSMPDLKVHSKIPLREPVGIAGIAALSKSTFLVAAVSAGDDKSSSMVIWDYKANAMVSERVCSQGPATAFCADSGRGIVAIGDSGGKVTVFKVAVKGRGKK
jgi:WD40 repeat protein